MGEWVHTSKYQDAIEGWPPASNAHTTPGGKHNNKIQLLGLRRFLLLRQRLLCQHLLHSAAPRCWFLVRCGAAWKKVATPHRMAPLRDAYFQKFGYFTLIPASLKCFNCKFLMLQGWIFASTICRVSTRSQSAQWFECTTKLYWRYTHRLVELFLFYDIINMFLCDFLLNSLFSLMSATKKNKGDFYFWCAMCLWK